MQVQSQPLCGSSADIPLLEGTPIEGSSQHQGVLQKYRAEQSYKSHNSTASPQQEQRSNLSSSENAYAQRCVATGIYYTGNVHAQHIGLTGFVVERSEKQIRCELGRLYKLLQRSEKYQKYREKQPALTPAEVIARDAAERKEQERRKAEGLQQEKDKTVWPDFIEYAFWTALVRWPPMGRKKYMLEGTQRGRNELIKDSIYRDTGIRRDRKQISSHLQVLKSKLRAVPADLSIVVDGDEQPVHCLNEVHSDGKLDRLDIADLASCRHQYHELDFLRPDTDKWTRSGQNVLVCTASLGVLAEVPPKSDLTIAFSLYSRLDLSRYDSLECMTRFYGEEHGAFNPELDSTNCNRKDQRTLCEYRPDFHGSKGVLRVEFDPAFRLTRMRRYQNMSHGDDRPVRDSCLTTVQDIYGIIPGTGEAQCLCTVLWRFQQTRNSAEADCMNWRSINFTENQSTAEGLGDVEIEHGQITNVSTSTPTDITPYHQASELPVNLVQIHSSHHSYELESHLERHPPSLSINILGSMQPDLDALHGSAATTTTDFSQQSFDPPSDQDTLSANVRDNDFELNSGHMTMSGVFETAIHVPAYGIFTSQGTGLEGLHSLAGLEHDEFAAMGLAIDEHGQYLILPPSSSPPSSSPPAGSPSKTVAAHFGIDTRYDRLGFYNKAEKRKTEIDTQTQTPVFASAHVDETMSNSTPLDGVFKIEDFMDQHKDAHQAQILAREAKHAAAASPPSKKSKLNENVAPLKPVAVGARSSKHTILLHEKYQALGIPQPLFTYEGGSETGWTVSVSFPGLDDADELQGLSEAKKFNSKQEAKEAMSQKALAVLKRLEEEGKVQKAHKSNKKKKKSAGGQAVQQVEEEKEPGENFIGQLLEFQRATDSPQPTYTDYQSGQRFACILTIEGLNREFGSIDSLFSSKKAARRDAARHAVEYFKSIGTWPDDVTLVGGIKKRKVQPSIVEMVSISTPDRTPSQASTSASTKSYAQQVANLAVILALPTPEWQYTSHPEDPNFHTVTCFFRGAGAHEGPIGEVRNIYGKKKAKEECARLTLEYLKEVREKRVAYGAAVMKGIAGAKGVLAAAAGKPIEGEDKKVKEDAAAMRKLEKDMGESSSEEDDVFADALEA
ncbi:hypothetical protein G6011_02143 [Alternaria panax]|uniref:TEA domain-containing protein n=1 Tax=Alternaria panax TaxID=48097 RepID=A0AAD4I4A6_9PLEO|nr:hypothetical protein G6011_02143 [Alternaria panax]